MDTNNTENEEKGEDTSTATISGLPNPNIQVEKQKKHNLTTKQLRWQKKMRNQPGSVKMKKEDGLRHEYYKNLVDPEVQNEIEVPRVLCVADRVESSTKEMNAMLKAVSQHTNNRAILQKIPRHMRRRAASHSRKRLPRRLHKLAEEIASQSQKENVEGKVTKAPNRKKRRRKRDLQNVFAKRSGKHGWLETHVWHAKRFHMSESTDPMYSGWGNRIALFPNDKSFRACYRAVSKHCLIQDISYLRCLRLSGSIDDLSQLIKSISAGDEFDCVAMEGQKEKDILLYKTLQGSNEGEKRMECIGTASVLWRPLTCNEGKSRELLMWIHPTTLSFSLELLNSICKRYELDVKIKNVSDELLRFRLTGPKSSVTLLSVLRPLNHPSANEHNPKCQMGEWLSENKDLVAQLHGDYNSVMTDCHRRIFARNGNEIESDNVPEYPNGSLFPVITNDPRLTLPLDKETPTLTKIKKKLNESDENSATTVEYKETNLSRETQQQQYDGIICKSPIWNDEIRNQVSSSRLADHIVSTRKREQKFQLSGEKIQNKSLTTAVPVLIIRKARNENRDLKSVPNSGTTEGKSAHSGPDESFGSGWDIILPRGWGTAFWIPLIYNRARAGGLRENKNTCLESLSPHFPQDYPDTESGKFHWEAEANKLANKYYRKPPAKRPNYSVLAVPNPFKPDWSKLFESKSDTHTKSLKRSAENVLDAEPELPEKRPKIESNHKCDDEIVAHDNNTLMTEKEQQLETKPPAFDNEFTENLNGSTTLESHTSSQITVLRNIEKLVSIKEWIINNIDPNVNKDDDAKFSSITQNPQSLICVGVRSLNKGIPFPRSMICIPTCEDLDNLCKDIKDPYKYGLQSVTGPCEPKHWDPYRKERKEARKVARKRKKNKKKDKVLVSDDITKDEIASNDAELASAPKQPQIFPVQPSREVIGYITSGDFLFSYACGAGIGFVSTEKLSFLASEQGKHEHLKSVLLNETSRKNLLDGDDIVPLLALIRNTDSVQYRFVKLEIQKLF